MSVKPAVLVGDAHTHTNPVRGMGARVIAPRFKSAGGWFAALLTLTTWSYGLEPRGVEAFKKMYRVHLAECRAAREAGLRVACFAGIHPAEVDRMIDRFRVKPEIVLEIGLRVAKLLGRLCREGAIDGVGEVGRQHYKTTALRVSIAETIMEEAVAQAIENGCLVQLHLENEGLATVETVSRILERAGVIGLTRAEIIFHHATLTVAREAVARGYSATIPGVPQLLDHAARTEPPFYMIESDHIDDPFRPGVVVYPWDMAAKLKQLASQGLEEWVYRVAVDNIVETFKTTPP